MIKVCIIKTLFVILQCQKERSITIKFLNEMKLDFFTTKRYTYIVVGNVIFQKKEQGYPKVNEVPFERVEWQNFTTQPVFSTEVEGEVIEEVIKDGYAQFCEFSKNIHQDKKGRNEQAKRALEADFICIEKEIKEGRIFETNEANIRRVLLYLNSMNWGIWQLPAMTIGYSAHQYDCDGHQATTITLDEPINYQGERVCKFKVGGGRQHLTQYRYI